MKQHLRKGKTVHHYERGEGSAPRQVIGAKSHALGGTYRVNINYADVEPFDPTGKRYPESHGKRTEHLTIRAQNYQEAITKGLGQSGDPGAPISVRMRRL